MALGDVLARLSVELGLDTASFSTGARKARKDSKDLGDSAEAMGRRIGGATKAIAAAGLAVAGGLVIGQLKQMVQGGLDYASALGEQAKQLGVTTKELQQYRYAASQVGISQEEMDKGLAFLSRKLGEVAQGAKTPTNALKNLGLSAAEIAKVSKLTAGEALPLLADAFSKLKSPTEQAAVAADLFGSKMGSRFITLLGEGSKGLNNLRDAADRLGIVLSDEQIQKADETADKLSALSQVLQAKISGAVADNTDSILELVNALIKLVEYAGKAARAWRIYVEAIRGGKSVRQAALDDLGPGVQLTFTPAELAARRAGVGAGRVPQSLRKPGSSYQLPGKIAPGAFNPFGKFATSDEQFDAGRNTAALAALQQMAVAASAAGQRAVPVLVELAGATQAANDNFAKMGPVAQSLFERLFPDEAANRQYEADLKALRAELDAGRISLERYEEARRRLSVSSLGGNPVSDYGINDTVFADVGPLEVDIGKVEDALDRFGDKSEVTTVRVAKSFADMAQQTINSLQGLTSAIKGRGFLDILSAALGLFTQLGSTGLFGKTLQGRINAPVSTGGYGGGSGQIPRYAGGTGFHRGGLALVGERGPELVSLPRGSAVWPNGTGPRGGGGIAQIVPSKYFDVVVDGRIVSASPSIMAGGAEVSQRRMARAQSRRLA